MIDRETIDRIRDQASIVAVIGEALKLRKRGRSHVGLCPFHQEKTPSFNVDEERGFYHCFGCGASGDVFTFLEQHEGLTFGEAVRRLAERVGVEIEETSTPEARRREDDVREQRQLLCDIGSAAAEYFGRMLREHPLRGCAERELSRRALSASAPPDPIAEALDAFRVGYAPYGWAGLAEHLSQSGLDLPAAERAGLLSARRGSGHVDRFRHRLMLAVLDLHGRVVAFAGRALPEPSDDELRAAGAEPMSLLEAGGVAEQLGCPESLVHRPQQLVFGLHQARQAIRAADQAVLVGDCFDVLSLHAHGVQNAIATPSPVPTTEQSILIKRFTTRVTLLRPADSVGRRAVDAARDPLRSAGLLVRVATLPPNTSAAQVVGERGGEAVRQALAAARGVLEFLIDSAIDSQLATDAPPRRVARVRYVAGLLAGESDPLVRAMAEQYVDGVVQRLQLGQVRTFRQLRGQVQRDLSRAVPVDPSAGDPEAGDPEAGDLEAGDLEAGDLEAGDLEAESGEVDEAALAAQDDTGRDVLGALLDYPELLGEEALGSLLQRLTGDAAAAVAAARRAWDGAQAIEAESFLGRLAPDLRRYAQDRLQGRVHQSAEDARAAIVTTLGPMD